MCICIFVYMYICIYVYMYICIFEYMYICKYVNMYMCICVYKYICIYVYMYICIYVYMYICIYHHKNKKITTTKKGKWVPGNCGKISHQSPGRKRQSHSSLAMKFFWFPYILDIWGYSSQPWS